jgi:hypothetical protein
MSRALLSNGLDLLHHRTHEAILLSTYVLIQTLL